MIETVGFIDSWYPILKNVFFLFLVLLVANIVISWLRALLAKKAHTRRQKSNIEIFLRFIKYGLFLSAVIAIILRSSASFQQFGIVLGALTAALGFALQKPISSVAAWIMMIVKRPFDIGDRIIIGESKGNVVDISLTHIHLEEVGRYGGEEVSGRVVMIPNSVLFEQNVVNYSQEDDCTLGQVVVTVSYKSNIDHVLDIVIAAAKKHTNEWSDLAGRSCHTRLYFALNGMEVHVRYYVPFAKAQIVATNVTKEIYDLIKQAEDIEISYPHTKVILEK